MEGLSLLNSGGLGLLPRKRKRRSAYDEDILYQDSEDGPGLLSRIGSTALSGVSAVGNFLDLPGSFVRDTLGGENPFDQLLSPFHDTNRLTGRDLLRKHGLVGSEDTYGNWWGGLGAEIVLDPTTYLGVGALTKAGKAVKAAGLLGDAALDTAKLSSRIGGSIKKVTGALANLHPQDAIEGALKLDKARTALGAMDINEPLQSLLHVGIPFTDVGVHIGDTGPIAQKIAGVLDTAGATAKASAPVRALRMLFDPVTGGKLALQDQLLKELQHPGLAKAEKAARQNYADEIDGMNEVFDAHRQFFEDSTGIVSTSPDDVLKGARGLMQKAARMTTETGHDFTNAIRYVSPIKSVPIPATLAPMMESLTKKAQGVRTTLYQQVLDKGGEGGILGTVDPLTGLVTDNIHNPRYGAFKSFKDMAEARRNVQTKSPSMLARAEATKTTPTPVVNDLMTDPAIRTASGAAVILNPRGKYFKYLDPSYPGGIAKQADDIAEYVAEHKAEEMFTREWQDDNFKYLQTTGLVNKNLDAVHTFIRQNIFDGTGAIKTGGDPRFQLERVFSRARMNPDRALDHLSSLTGKSVTDLRAATLDEDVANAIVGSHQAVSNPIWAGALADGFDKFNKWFKQWVTLPFPGFVTRNLTGGQFVNATSSGAIDGLQDLGKYSSWMWKMGESARKGVDKDLMAELYANKVFSPKTASEGVDTGAWGMDLLGPQNPLGVKDTWAQAGDNLKDSVIAGIMGKAPGGKQAAQAGEFVLGTGAKANQWVEWLNRVPMYMYLTRDKGWDSLAAAAKVNSLQVDYSALAPFEKDVMRRLVPFYSWQRRIAPVLMETLLKKPGGALAQTIRLENRAHGENALTPEHVASTLAIPNPWKTPEEGQSYITGFGLPFEQTAQFFGNFPSLREGGREALSQTTPLIKAPLEWASGQSFFQSGSGGAGRPLEELDPTLSRTISNVTGAKLDTPDLLEFAVSNSPLSRIASTARTATDARKTYGERALNLLTGVRVTDVSPAAEDAVLRERAKEVMRDLGAKTFEKVYFSKEDLAQMDPKQRAEAEKFQALMALLATKAKERKKLAAKKKN